MRARLYIRIRLKDGRHPFTEPVYSANNKIKPFFNGGRTYHAEVKLVGQPQAAGPYPDNFEACLYYQGKLIPGAFPTHSYPPSVQNGGVGFPNAFSLFRWWQCILQNGHPRFMVWYSETPEGYFDRKGKFYSGPYDISSHNWLPVP